jgi:hypothetical protein
VLSRSGLFRSLLENLDYHQDEERDSRQYDRHRISPDVIAIIKRSEYEESGGFG